MDFITLNQVDSSKYRSNRIQLLFIHKSNQWIPFLLDNGFKVWRFQFQYKMLFAVILYESVYNNFQFKTSHYWLNALFGGKSVCNNPNIPITENWIENLYQKLSYQLFSIINSAIQSLYQLNRKFIVAFHCIKLLCICLCFCQSLLVSLWTKRKLYTSKNLFGERNRELSVGRLHNFPRWSCQTHNRSYACCWCTELE